jgi:glycosyltransferase involved in cell wall biosynthesis
MHDEWWLNAINHYRVETEFQKNARVKNAIISYILKQKTQLLSRSNVILICPSKELKNISIGAFPEIKNNVYEIPNPVPTRIFYHQPIARFNNRLILFAGGTQDPRKGYDLFLDALRVMKEECTVIVLGKSGVETTGSNQQILIMGKPWVSSESEMNRIYGECSLTVVPSRQEAFGQVACESIMAGTPVASFEVGGLKDIVLSGFNGFRVENFNTTKLAHELDQFLCNDSFNRSYIAADAKIRFSEESVVNAYLEILR